MKVLKGDKFNNNIDNWNTSNVLDMDGIFKKTHVDLIAILVAGMFLR